MGSVQVPEREENGLSLVQRLHLEVCSRELVQCSKHTMSRAMNSTASDICLTHKSLLSDIFFFFNVNHLNLGEVAGHCNFDLHFPDNYKTTKTQRKML